MKSEREMQGQIGGVASRGAALGAEAPAGERMRIVFAGRRNAGKSALVNALAGQEVSLVSPVAGTTTDPVRKSVEWLPAGPCLLVDTAGLDDDQASLGPERVRRAMRELRAADFVVLAVPCDSPDALAADSPERAAADALRRAGVPFLCALTKADLADGASSGAVAETFATQVFPVSAATGAGVAELRRAIAESDSTAPSGLRIVGDRLRPGDIVVLVTPIDAAAPKGRLILPQQQTLRDVLDAAATAVVVQPAQLPGVFAALSRKPTLVITDSQVFAEVRRIVPQDVPLTSFSVLFARYKGDWEVLRDGAGAVSALRDGDSVLISEGCTHRRQCGDIGTQKIPRWLSDATGRKLDFSFTSGRGWPDRPEELKRYALVVHCGGCMLARREMRRRVSDCLEAGVPIVNYGVLIAKLRGVELPEDPFRQEGTGKE